MTAGPPAADSVAGQQTQTFHISTAATAVDISQLAIYLQSYYKEVGSPLVGIDLLHPSDAQLPTP